MKRANNPSLSLEDSKSLIQIPTFLCNRVTARSKVRGAPLGKSGKVSALSAVTDHSHPQTSIPGCHHLSTSIMELNADMHAATMEPGSDLEAFRKMLEALQLSRGVSTAESEEPAQKPTKGKLTIQEVELAIKNAYTTKDNIILAVAELSRLLGLTASDLISAHTSGPSFVASEWHTSYNLPADPHQIEVVPPHESYMLPIDFQTRVYEQMWVSIGVFSSKHIEQHNEATAVRMIEPVAVSFAILFIKLMAKVGCST